VGASLACALVAALPGTPLPARAPVASADDGVGSPPAGTWESVAHGDRVVELVRAGGALWSASDGGGLVRWDLSAEPAAYRQLLAPQSGLPSNVVRDVDVDPARGLWLATRDGLALMDIETESFTRITPDTSPGMPDGGVTAVALEPGGAGLWVGFEQRWSAAAASESEGDPRGAFVGGGIARLDLEAGTWSEHARAVREPPPPGSSAEGDFETIPSDNVTALAFGSDGALWVGTRPYLEWLETCAGDCAAAWVLSGGGIAARTASPPGAPIWRRWRRGGDPVTDCYGDRVSALRADAEGRVWVGTLGDGVLLMQGPEQSANCGSGQAYYGVRRGTGDRVAEGLRGRMVWSLDVDPAGRLWIGHGSSAQTGTGIAILDHKGTFHDSSASPMPWVTDDVWRFLDLPGAPSASPWQVTAIDASNPARPLFGAVERTEAPDAGDGPGIFELDEAAGAWSRRQTAPSGLPSNSVRALAVDPRDGALWVSTSSNGVARRDPRTGDWSRHEAFRDAGAVASLVGEAGANFARLRVDIPDSAAFEAALPGPERLVRLGGLDRIFRALRYIPERSGIGPFIELSEPPGIALPDGTRIVRVERGPAGNRATGVAFRGESEVWVGALKSMWQTDRTGGCPAYPDCWLDGGVGRWDGSEWRVRDPHNSPFGDHDVADVAVAGDGRLWLALSDLSSRGTGFLAHDPEADTWEEHRVSVEMPAGDGAAAVEVDPVTGEVWTAHFPIETIARLPDGTYTRVFYGGGVSRFDGERWTSQGKSDPGSTLRGYGTRGTFTALTIERPAGGAPDEGRVWLGGWDADGGPERFHWPSGSGVHAVVNFCPIAACTPDSWRHAAWPEDGEVTSIAPATDGRVWVGLSRRGLGTIPAPGGIRILDGDSWSHISRESSAGALPDESITALAAVAELVGFAGPSGRAGSRRRARPGAGSRDVGRHPAPRSGNVEGRGANPRYHAHS